MVLEREIVGDRDRRRVVMEGVKKCEGGFYLGDSDRREERSPMQKVVGEERKEGRTVTFG